jgi:anti-anti-sigma factor
MSQIAPGWQVEIAEVAGWVVVKVANPQPEPLDAPPLAEQVRAALDARHNQRLLLDLSEVPLLYSHLVGQLVLLQKRVTVLGGEMRVCGLSPGNRQVLHLCRLDERFPDYRTRDDALAARPQP